MKSHGAVYLSFRVGEVPEAFAVDVYDQDGDYIDTFRVDDVDINRCENECNCTPGEKMEAGYDLV